MRTARTAVVVSLILPVTVARGQDPPAVDRTDPKAVAEAYITACRAGDVEAAVALLGGDETLLRTLRQVLGYAMAPTDGGQPGFSWAESFRESLCLPFPGALPMTHALKETAVDGDRAQLSYDVALAMEQKLVLTRGQDGTWAVDIVESAKATGGGRSTYVAQMLEAISTTQGARALAAYESQATLRRLENGLREYAAEHDGCLPPAERWMDEIELYVLDRSAWRSPGAPDLAYGFAMNVGAGGRKYASEEGMPGGGEEFPILFEWPSGERNATATPEQLAQTPSFWPDGSVAVLTSWGEIEALPKGVTLQQKRAAQMEAAEANVPDADDPGFQVYACARNLQILATAARRYARDHGGLLPAAERWQDDLAPYILLVKNEDWWGSQEGEPNPFHCPAAQDIEFGYAINSTVAGKNALDLTDQASLVLFFESNLNTPNAARDPERDKCDPPRHRVPWMGDDAPGVNQVAYVTGQTGYYGRPEFDGGMFGGE